MFFLHIVHLTNKDTIQCNILNLDPILTIMLTIISLERNLTSPSVSVICIKVSGYSTAINHSVCHAFPYFRINNNARGCCECWTQRGTAFPEPVSEEKRRAPRVTMKRQSKKQLLCFRTALISKVTAARLNTHAIPASAISWHFWPIFAGNLVLL